MPRIKYRDPDGVDLTLPDFLFYKNDAKSKSISPTASFDPAQALHDNPWQSATSPSNQLNQKSIVFDAESFVPFPQMNKAEAISLISRLKNAGFKIYLRVKGLEKFVEFDDKVKNVGEYLSILEKFDSKKDYSEIAKSHQVERDKLVLLDLRKICAVENALTYERYKSGAYGADAWQVNVRNYDDFDGILSGAINEIIMSETTEDQLSEKSCQEAFYRRKSELDAIFLFTLSSLDSQKIPDDKKREEKIRQLCDNSSNPLLKLPLFCDLDTEKLEIFAKANPSASKSLFKEIIVNYNNNNFHLSANDNRSLKLYSLGFLLKHWPHNRYISQADFIAKFAEQENFHKHITIKEICECYEYCSSKSALTALNALYAEYKKHGNNDILSSRYDLAIRLHILKKTSPEKEAEKLLDENIQKIEYDYEHLACLKAAPKSRSLQIVMRAIEKIGYFNATELLLKILEAAPEHALVILNGFKTGKKIRWGWGYVVIDGVTRRATDMIGCHQPIFDIPLKNLLKIAPAQRDEIVNFYAQSALNIPPDKDLDPNPSQRFVDCLEAAPDLAEELIEKYFSDILQNIKIVDERKKFLTKCFKVLTKENSFLIKEWKSLVEKELKSEGILPPVTWTDEEFDSFSDFKDFQFDSEDSLHFLHKIPDLLDAAVQKPIYGEVDGLGRLEEFFLDTSLRERHEIAVNYFDHLSPYQDLSKVKNKPTLIQFFHLPTKEELDALGEDLANVAVVRIVGYRLLRDEMQDIARLVTYFEGKKLKHLVLPKPMEIEFAAVKDFLAEKNITCEFVDFDKYKIFEDVKKAERQREKDKIRKEAKILREQIRNIQESADSNIIRIGVGNFKKEMTAEMSDNTNFTMAQAGEVLNKTLPKIQVRTAIIKRNIAESLKQEEYVPSAEKLKSITPKILTEEKIAEFKASKTDTYYRFNLPLKAGQKFRLSSISTREELMGIMTNNNARIEIQKGDDDFYYAVSDLDCRLSWVVKTSDNVIDSFDQMSKDNPIRKAIEEFKERRNEVVEVPQYNPEKHTEWLEQLFKDGSGACRHLVAAMEYQLLLKKFSPSDIRAVNINANHVVLEVRENGQWFKADLGGSPAQLNNVAIEYSASAVKEKAPEIKKAPEVKAPKVEATKVEVPVSVCSKSQEENPAPKTENPVILEAEKIAREKILQRRKNMSSEFKKLLQLEKVETEQELAEKISAKNKKVLIVTKKLNEHANYLIAKAKAEGREVYYIDSPEKIDIFNKNLFIQKNRNELDLEIKESGLLHDFIDDALEEKPKSPLLLINFDAFSPSKKVALNSAIDIDRTINGMRIADDVQIISFCEEKPQDPSFLSRHNVCVSSQLSPNSEPKISENAEVKEIDLQGFPNWRRALFGRVNLVGEKMEWQKSEFVKDLELDTIQNFKIKNLSESSLKELQYELQQARALGAFTYHGYKISIPENLTLNFEQSAFNFKKFSVAAKSDVTAQSTSGLPLINSHYFDYLLQGKEIINGQYIEKSGLLEESSGKKLPLFVSGSLSDSQWYCLFNQAQQFQVELEIFLAPSVKIPTGVSLQGNTMPLKEISLAQKPKIFVSNDPAQTFEKLKKDQEIFIAIDMEDAGYQDLIENITFDLNENKFENFKKVESELYQALRAGKNVVLKGSFAPDLLEMLHDIMLRDLPNLTLIIEDKSVLKPDEIYAPLKFLPKNQYEIKVEAELPKAASQNYYEKIDEEKLDDQSKKKSDDFIEKRKTQFKSLIENNNILELVGHSGVGKSRLMKMYEEDPNSPFKIFREMANFKNMVNDPSDKIKILFIDESNIEDSHFTMLSPLKRGGNRRVLYQGEILELGENCRIVMARNPKSYGGGRADQKLFEDDTIPQMHLADFPASYIYEKILKESIYDELRQDVKDKISPEEFKNHCAKLIENYQKVNKEIKGDIENLTVRELQEQALEYIDARDEEKMPEENWQKIRSNNFVSTTATKEIEIGISTTARIRAKQREGKFPSKAVGINGGYIAGNSGTGKSQYYQNFFDEDLKKTGKKYHRIDADLPLAEKKKIIIYAFERGERVWIDELNSCIDDGLEKILNAVLTGAHPDTGKAAAVSGFELYATGNDVGLEGRSNIPPSLQHRLKCFEMKTLQQYSAQELSEIVRCWLDSIKAVDGRKVFEDEQKNKIADEIAKDFQELLQGEDGEILNLRMLRNITSKPEFLRQYADFDLPEIEIKSSPSSTIYEAKIIDRMLPNLIKRIFNRNIDNSEKGIWEHQKMLGSERRLKVGLGDKIEIQKLDLVLQKNFKTAVDEIFTKEFPDISKKAKNDIAKLIATAAIKCGGIANNNSDFYFSKAGDYISKKSCPDAGTYYKNGAEYIEQNFSPKLGIKSAEALVDLAQKVSGRFQNINFKNGIYSGREEGDDNKKLRKTALGEIKTTGLRLAFCSMNIVKGLDKKVEATQLK